MRIGFNKKVIIISIISLIIIVGVFLGIFSLLNKAEKPPLYVDEEEMIIDKHKKELDNLRSDTPLTEEEIQQHQNELDKLRSTRDLSLADISKQIEELNILRNK